MDTNTTQAQPSPLDILVGILRQRGARDHTVQLVLHDVCQRPWRPAGLCAPASMP